MKVQKISFDFDGCLSNKQHIQQLAMDLSMDGHNELYIITRRYGHIRNGHDEVSEVLAVARQLRIPVERVHFMNREYKYTKVKELGINLHFDDDIQDIMRIQSTSPDCMTIWVK